MERQMVGRVGIGKRGKTEEEENKDEGGGYSMGENKNTQWKKEREWEGIGNGRKYIQGEADEHDE